MKILLKAVLIVFGFTNSIVQADVFANEDDTYLGFQMTTPLDSNDSGLRWGANQYRYLIMRQKNGINDGLELLIDSSGRRSVNYLKPSSNYNPGGNGNTELALAILRLDAEADSGTADSMASGVAGLVLVSVFIARLKHDLEKPFVPASP